MAISMSIAGIVLAHLLAVVSAVGDPKNANGVTFLYPPGSMTINNLDTINTTWTSKFTAPWLYFLCQKTEQVKTNGTSAILFDFRDYSSCYFNLRPNPEQGGGANSEDIVLLENARSLPVTHALGQAEIAPEQVVTAATTTQVSTVVVTQTPASDQARSGELSMGAKTGLGVGVAVVVVSGGFLIFYCLARRSRRRQVSISDNPLEIMMPRQPVRKIPSVSVASTAPSDDSVTPTQEPAPTLRSQRTASTVRSERTRRSTGRSTVRSRGSGRPDTRRDGAVELCNIDPALHELHSPDAVHEIGPGRWENTGFNFPPEKSAFC
ncbi:hypothetical protein BJ875DRAFT_446231 [Amylocarpus encephaloides]|uniref:Mid2 domain-containing protein n=1 Tax=Amylocarpus encephaloides TaxID=45428 RepID=A0A9P8C0S7_9HELO|nr:hypothetical protein BJ875DRAFT_446231 [Amylocarpus encephaloides]